MLFSVVGVNGAVLINLPGWLCLQIAGICVLLYGSWKSKIKVAESIRSVLLPVAIGQAAVLLLTAAFQYSENPFLIRLDNWLNLFYARYHNWFEFRLSFFAGIVILLVLLNFLFHRARLVTRFLTLERYLHFVSAVLVVVASFTFAAQYPYSLGTDRDAKVMPREKSPEEEVETKQLNRVSAAILEEAFKAMPREQLMQYAILVQRVDKEVRWTHHQEALRNSLASAFSDDSPAPEASEHEVFTQPEGASAEVTDDEAWLGLYKTLDNALSKLIPVPEGTLGEFAKSLVEDLSERLWERGYRSPVGESFQAVVERISAWLTPRMEALALKPVDANVRSRRTETGRESDSTVSDLKAVRERRESPLTAILQDRIREGAKPKDAEDK